ncbi:MAG TPA: DUF2163 domain-containing protein [Hyphomicrobiaceae bacterium]|nr:DUF2163 domain-containing protein [Hyphomicrobiaceae bacterium]
MKTLPAGMTEHLASGATTLCWCWRLVRRDGSVLGFTDHDRALSFDGTMFEAQAGFTASEIKESIGLNVDNLDVQGAVTSERLSEADLAAGLYDDAQVEIYRMNWQAPEQRVLMRSGSLGEVRRSGGGFTAEVRGLAHYLQQPKGRLFQYHCDADLGDGRCGVPLESEEVKGEGIVSETLSAHQFTATGLDSFINGWFDRGRLVFETGVNAGRAFEIKRHQIVSGIATLSTWHATIVSSMAGDAFSVWAGCDKSFSTCRDKFANATAFRGFPHMPGNAFVSTFQNKA